MKKRLIFVLFVLILLLSYFIYYYNYVVDRSLSRIKNRGSITLLTTLGPTTYFKYRNHIKGFDYELAKDFAEFLGVDLNVIVTDWESIIPMLLKGKGDFIGSGLTITPKRKQIMDFSDGYLITSQHIISHKYNRLYNIKSLEGKTITVRKVSSYYERLNEILQEDNVSFKIALTNELTDALLEKVNYNKKFITVSDSHIALRLIRFYPNIRIRFKITGDQSIAWAIRKEQKALLDAMNDYFEHIKKNGFLEELKERYFSSSEICDCYDVAKFHTRIRERLPQYIKIIKRESAKYGFDWRLIAAVIYQESHYNRHAVSHTGVKGLMQLTKTTAERMKIHNRLDPEQSIIGGVKYLDLLYRRFKNIPEEDRWRYALAAYNVGAGHVDDAMRLAKKLGLDPKKWISIKKTLPMLANKKYYSQSKYGYTRGWEGVNYVKRISKYYDILQMYEINKNIKMASSRL
jgi:membrane-bound lytic murein transglycosylase F